MTQEVKTEIIATFSEAIVIHSDGQGGGDGGQALAAHIAAADPHPQYATDANLAATNAQVAAKADSSALTAHTSITNGNPHGTTAAQVGAYSIAQADALLSGKANTNDSRLTDQRIPTDGSVTNAKVAAGAAIAWSKIDKTGSLPADVGAAPASHTQPWNTITATPTTIAGYGITDAVNSSAVGTAIARLSGGQHLATESRASTISYNSVTGVISFTDARGTLTTIDLPIENLFQNASYNSGTQTLTLTTNGGGALDISLATLVDLPEIVVATSTPGSNPTTGQRLYLRSDTGEYWISTGSVWAGPFLPFTSAERTKLAGIQLGATANATNAELRDRATHTGTQAWSTITATPATLAGYGITDAASASHTHSIANVTGLQTALDGKVNTSDPRLTDARTPTAHNQAWTTITGTPTTLSGYGITDGFTVFGTPTNGQVPKWNSTTLRPEWSADATAAGGSGGVSTFAGRTGDVSPQASDYSSFFVGASDSRLTDQRVPTDGSVTDVKIGSRTVDQTLATPGNTGTLTQVLSWIVGRIRAITGTANWFDNPGTTLAATATHIANTSNPHSVTAAQVGSYTTSQTDSLLAGKANTTDPRFTDARTPLAHNQPWSTITLTPTTLGGYGITDAVSSSDSRLTDSRTPLAHTQAISTITGLQTALDGKLNQPFGTPTNNQVIKWDATNSRPYWGTDLEGSGGGGSIDLSSPPSIGNVAPNTGSFTTLGASRFNIGSDLLATPVSGGQSLVCSWWGLQLGGLKSDMLMGATPTNVGNPGEYCVVIAPGATQAAAPSGTFTALGVVQRSWQTGGFFQRWVNSAGTDVASLDLNGVLSVPTLNPTNALAVNKGGTGATTASGARTNLSVYSTSEVDSLLGAKANTSALGTLASQNANSVNITGGSLAGITSLATTGNVSVSGNISASSASIVGNNAAVSPIYILNGSASGKDFTFQTGGLSRWNLRCTAGDDFQILARNDDGTARDTPLAIPRATGGSITSNRAFNFLALSTPTTPTSGFSLYSDASNRFAWVGANGFIRTFDATAITANRVWTFPDATGTVALRATTLAGYGITDAVSSSDSRLTDARTPLAHNQVWSTITATPTTLSGYGITDAYTRAEVDTAVGGRLQVFGTPANGLIPKWNAANSRAEWSTDATGSGGGLAAFDYIQSTVPSSPTDRQRWLEVDASGTPIESWYWDAANSRWLSMQVYYSSRHDWGVSASQTAMRYPMSVPGAWSSLVLVTFNILFTSIGNHSGSAIWTFQPGTSGGGANAQPIPGSTVLSSDGYLANTRANYLTNYSTPLAIPTATESFCNVITRSGAPANLFLTQTSGVRKVR